MTSEELAADRRAFVEQLLAEKRQLERGLAAVDAAILIYTNGNVVAAAPKENTSDMGHPAEPPPAAPEAIPSDLVGVPEPPSVLHQEYQSGDGPEVPAETPEPTVKAAPAEHTDEVPANTPANVTAVVIDNSPVGRPSVSGGLHAKTKMFTPARNRIIVQQWRAGTPEPEIRRLLEAISGLPIPPGRIAVQANKMGLHRPDKLAEPKPKTPPPPGRMDMIRQVAASLAAKSPITQSPAVPSPSASQSAEDYDPGPAVYAEYGQVQRWAAERGIQFRTWEDLPAVNRKREALGQSTFKRDFTPRRVG